MFIHTGGLSGGQDVAEAILQMKKCKFQYFTNLFMD